MSSEPSILKPILFSFAIIGHSSRSVLAAAEPNGDQLPIVGMVNFERRDLRNLKTLS
jgi:hypothetical protein